MKAVINGLEVALKTLEIVTLKQDKLEREIKKITSQLDNLLMNIRKYLRNPVSAF